VHGLQDLGEGHVTRMLLVAPLQQRDQVHHVEVIPLVEALAKPVQIGQGIHQGVVLLTWPDVLQQHFDATFIRSTAMAKVHVWHFI